MEELESLLEAGRLVVVYDPGANLNIEKHAQEAAEHILRTWAIVAETDPARAYGIWKQSEGTNEFSAVILRQAVRFRMEKKDALDVGSGVATILGIGKPMDVSFRSLFGCFENNAYSFEQGSFKSEDPIETILWQQLTIVFEKTPVLLFVCLWLIEGKPMILLESLRRMVGGCGFLTIQGVSVQFMPESLFAGIDLQSMKKEENTEDFEAFLEIILVNFLQKYASFEVVEKEGQPYITLLWNKGLK
jgi:hypothetical protein